MPQAPLSGLGGAEHDALDPGRHEGPSTHRAGLQRHDEGGALQVPAAEGLGSGSQRQHLGMRRRVLPPLALVARLGHDSPSHQDDGPHRHVPRLAGLSGQREGEVHRRLVVQQPRGARHGATVVVELSRNRLIHVETGP